MAPPSFSGSLQILLFSLENTNRFLSFVSVPSQRRGRIEKRTHHTRLVIGIKLVGISLPYAHTLRIHRQKSVASRFRPSRELGG